MKRDDRSASRFSSGCGHDGDCHAYSAGAAKDVKEKCEAVSIVGLTPGRNCMPYQCKSIRITIID